MARQIALALLVLAVVAGVGRLQYRHRASPAASPAASPVASPVAPPKAETRAETRVETVLVRHAPIGASGYSVGKNDKGRKIALGTSRAEVESLRHPSELSAVRFQSGLGGLFTNCPYHADAIVYDVQDRAVAIKGETLTVPDGHIIDQDTSEPKAIGFLGSPEQEKDEHGGSIHWLLYPSRGLALEFGADVHHSGGYYPISIEMTAPWSPDRPETLELRSVGPPRLTPIPR
jgi:hypothetical protein